MRFFNNHHKKISDFSSHIAFVYLSALCGNALAHLYMSTDSAIQDVSHSMLATLVFSAAAIFGKYHMGLYRIGSWMALANILLTGGHSSNEIPAFALWMMGYTTMFFKLCAFLTVVGFVAHVIHIHTWNFLKKSPVCKN